MEPELTEINFSKERNWRRYILCIRVELVLVAALKLKVKISDSLFRTAVNLRIHSLPWLHLHTDVFGKQCSTFYPGSWSTGVCKWSYK